MEFDRKGPEGGLEIYSFINNGKALLECKVHLRKTMMEEWPAEAAGSSYVGNREGYLDIRVWDREGREVLICHHAIWQDEPARGLLLHPHLWQGTEDPYLYRIQVSLLEKKDCIVDVLETTFALRTFREVSGKGWFLNNRLFTIKPVEYALPSNTVHDASRRMRIGRDLKLIREMGANTICPIEGKIDRELYELCDELGLLLWWRDDDRKNSDSSDAEIADTGQVGIPRFYGTADSLLALQSRFLTERYYSYKACWSKEPFVYISMESLRLDRSGNAEVMVYSNQKKAALYVEGILFEFRADGPDFFFRDIPVKRLPMLLTAEAGECSMSITAYPFT